MHHRAFPENFTVSSDFVRGLYLSPNGRRATTALGDGTLMVWEVLPPFRPARAVTNMSDAKEATRWWDDLASEDAVKGFATIWELIDAPERSVALLQRNVMPALEEDSGKTRQLLRDLDSNRFSVRESAAKELERMGSVVSPALRQALAANPPPEARRRLETLLSKISSGIPTAEVLRRLRAVLVLEQIGSPEAKEVLATLAKGAREARLTQEAKASLERLAKRPVGGR